MQCMCCSLFSLLIRWGKYTESSLGLACLKGADKARMAALQHFSKRYEYEIFLATMEHYRVGEPENSYDPYDHYGGRRGYWDDDDDEDDDPDRYEPIVDVMNSETKLKRLVSLDGSLVLADVDLDDEAIVQDEPFEDRMPDQHEYQGFTGNAGAESSHWYRDTVSCCLCYHVLQLMKLGHCVGASALSQRLPSRDRYKVFAERYHSRPGLAHAIRKLAHTRALHYRSLS